MTEKTSAAAPAMAGARKEVSPGNVCSAQGQLRTHAPQQREKVLEKPDVLFARSRHLGQCAIAAKTSATEIWVSGVQAQSLYRPRQQIALLSQVPSGSFRGCPARRLVEFTPVAPMGRLDIDVPLTPSVDPIGPVLVTRKWECMDDTIIVQHADLEIPVRRRHRSGLPLGGEGMHDVPP